MLAQSRVDEASAYFQIAREGTSRENRQLFIVNGIYSSITEFMVGNLTRAIAVLTETKAFASRCALHHYQLYLVFLEIRIQFELGRYETCVELCAKGLTLCALYSTAPKLVFEKWLCRSEAFAGRPEKAVKVLQQLPDDVEARLFLAEALYFGEREVQAVQTLEPELLDIRGRPEHLKPAELMQWETGFAQLEDRGIQTSGGGEFLSMQLRSFRAFLQSVVLKEETGVAELARITREEKLSDIDPNNGLYFYFYALAIGEASTEHNLDRLTALSKACKYIQERAATMDNAGDKQAYLRGNYFNSRILHDARDSNLM
jgi:hypothetical protein